MRLPDETIREYAATYGSRYNLPEDLVYAVILTESSGDPDAENPSDPSVGLMQCMADTGRRFGGLEGDDASVLNQLRDPDTNLRTGCNFLAHLQTRFGNDYPITAWVQAYNVGEGGFHSGRRNQAYGQTIQKYMDQFNRV